MRHNKAISGYQHQVKTNLCLASLSLVPSSFPLILIDNRELIALGVVRLDEHILLRNANFLTLTENRTKQNDERHFHSTYLFSCRIVHFIFDGFQHN